MLIFKNTDRCTVELVSFQNPLFWSDKTTEFNNLIYILGNEAILSHLKQSSNTIP